VVVGQRVLARDLELVDGEQAGGPGLGDRLGASRSPLLEAAGTVGLEDVAVERPEGEAGVQQGLRLGELDVRDGPSDLLALGVRGGDGLDVVPTARDDQRGEHRAEDEEASHRHLGLALAPNAVSV
jgi:hypothetical protein